jgi:hypothetical protein
MRSFASITLVVAAVGFSLPAAAQVTGLPVINSGISSGISITGMVGFPNSDYGKGRAYGARGTIGLGPIGFGAQISSYNPGGSADSYTAYGASANLKVFGGPLIPLSVTLQGAAEYGKPTDAIKVLHVPVGLGIALKIPNPALAIKPWIAPRIDYTRVEGGGKSDSKTNFGLSAGIDFSLLFGLGLSASYDKVFSGNGGDPAVFALGAGWTIKIPGL